MKSSTVPLGFGFALAMQPEALRNYAILPDSEKTKVLEKARNMSSKKEMESLINQLANGSLS